MKIGIITFIDTMNYGALLQGFALCRTLNNLGLDAKVINYRFQDFKKDYYSAPKFSYYFLFSPSGMARYILSRSIARHEKERFYRSRDFVSKNIPITSLCCTSADIDVLGMQVHICGSDQIWNPSITNGFFDAFFGGTSGNIKKISFSASCPEIDKLKAKQDEFLGLIKQMDSIAVREPELQDYLSELGVTSTLTIDPTLLLSREDYIEIAAVVKPMKPYVFIYNLGRKDGNMHTYAKKLAKVNCWDIIEIPTYRDFTAKHTQIFDAAPDRFLAYMVNAEYIITNSFHGTAFSIILKKNFSSFSVNLRSSRITNLLGRLGLTSRLNPNSLTETGIDYNIVNEKLTPLRESSLEYLRCAINIVK